MNSNGTRKKVLFWGFVIVVLCAACVPGKVSPPGTAEGPVKVSTVPSLSPSPLPLPNLGEEGGAEQSEGCEPTLSKPCGTAEATLTVEQNAIRALKEAQDEHARAMSASALGMAGPDTAQVIPALVQALKDKAPSVRYEAAMALMRVRMRAGPGVAEETDVAGPMLIQLLKKDEDAQVRSASAQALAAIGRPKEQVVLALTQALEEDTAPRVRGSAAFALGGFGDEKGVIPALVHTLEMEKNSAARWAIIEGLGSIGPKAKEAVPVLIRVLEGEETEVVRWNAARVLKTITGQDWQDAAHWRAWWEEQQH